MGSGEHAVLAERFGSDEAKWGALRKFDEGSAKQGVVADVVFIDDHDATSRVDLDVRPPLFRRRRLSVRPSVRLSVCLSVCLSEGHPCEPPSHFELLPLLPSSASPSMNVYVFPPSRMLCEVFCEQNFRGYADGERGEEDGL